MTIPGSTQESFLEQHGDLSGAMEVATSPIGVDILHDFVHEPDITQFTDAVREHEDWVRESVASFHVGKPWLVDEWQIILRHARSLAREKGVPLGEENPPQYGHDNGVIRLYGPKEFMSIHRDSLGGFANLAIAVSFTNRADFTWLDDNGEEHKEEVRPGSATIIRTNIYHKASAPKQAGERLMAVATI